jgi:hypothetical protein
MSAPRPSAPVVTLDLHRAARRSESFPKDWSPERTAAAIARYERFLLLVAEDPTRPVAPTREIDRIWHLHMLDPVAYHRDCTRLFGTILGHDGGFGTEPDEAPVLAEVFEDTARRWEARFGEPYAAEATHCWHDCSGRCWHACKR